MAVVWMFDSMYLFGSWVVGHQRAKSKEFKKNQLQISVDQIPIYLN